MYTLYFGNRNYSSWSLRPWLLMKHFGIPFEERRVAVSGKGANEAHRRYSANGLVPCLHVGEFQVWDTLAIAEFLAGRHPEMWPSDELTRARARSVSAEMHAGFGALRSAMPMNIKLRLQGRPADPAVKADIDRVTEIWQEARERFAGSRGPWLFGEFSVADAMYAPVVWRFHTYNVPLSGAAAAWCEAMRAHPAMRAWEAAALAEGEALAHYDAVAADFGGPR